MNPYGGIFASFELNPCGIWSNFRSHAVRYKGAIPVQTQRYFGKIVILAILVIFKAIFKGEGVEITKKYFFLNR